MSASEAEPFGVDWRDDDGVIPGRASTEDMTSGGECLLYSPARDEAAALNRTATEIWGLCDGQTSLSGIAGALAARYGVDPALLRDDVIAALAALESRGFVTLTRAVQKDIR